jgi:predicted DCC family thiol-disulfide oxidoreductase YuxK
MKKLIIFYDNWCPYCTRFANQIQKWDIVNLIQIRQLRNKHHTGVFLDIDLGLAQQQMASYNSGKWHYGYNSIYLILTRLLFFIWLFPVLYFLKVTNIGQFLYIQLALKRKIIPIHCNEDSCEI